MASRRRNTKKQGEADVLNKVVQEEATNVVEAVRPISIWSILLEIGKYVLILVIALNLFFGLIERIVGPEDGGHVSESSIRTDEFTEDVLKEIKANEPHSNALKPKITLDIEIPEGTPAQEYLSSQSYIESLKLSSFTEIQMPERSHNTPKTGPSKEDLLYINSRITPQKIVPIWNPNFLDSTVRKFDLRVFVNSKRDFNISNPRNRRATPNLSIKDFQLSNRDLAGEDLKVRISYKKLKSLAESDDLIYFHVYLSKHGVSLSDNYHDNLANDLVFHKRLEFKKQDILYTGLDGSIYVVPLLPVTIVHPEAAPILQYPLLSEALKSLINLDPANRRDKASGTISLYYPIVFHNSFATKKLPFVKAQVPSNDLLTLDLKITNLWSSFKTFITISHWLSQLYRAAVTSRVYSMDHILLYPVKSFSKGLIDMINLLYFLL